MSKSDSFPSKLTENPNYRTRVCKWDNCDKKCSFFHSEEERRINYFGVNKPFTTESYNEVLTWRCEQERVLENLQEEIRIGNIAYNKFQDTISEAKNMGIWLTLPKRNHV